ncbi:hypothetical protein B0H19DRAFT_1262104 [Mycena capillaripes]|nr:hypothetical protein B0H19DRAFT_1262104 [Mycena capillaripes]
MEDTQIENLGPISYKDRIWAHAIKRIVIVLWFKGRGDGPTSREEWDFNLIYPDKRGFNIDWQSFYLDVHRRLVSDAHKRCYAWNRQNSSSSTEDATIISIDDLSARKWALSLCGADSADWDQEAEEPANKCSPSATMISVFGTGVALISYLLPAGSPSSGQARAALMNVTIDDTQSQYWSFDGPWSAVTPNTPCSVCNARPDPLQVHNQTWHDGFLMSGKFTFQGSAVYIYGIDTIMNQAGNITFDMSELSVTAFHYPGKQDYVYNSLFFSATSLDPTIEPTVTWTVKRSTSTPAGEAALFDYAVIIQDQLASPSNPAVGSST